MNRDLKVVLKRYEGEDQIRFEFPEESLEDYGEACKRLAQHAWIDKSRSHKSTWCFDLMNMFVGSSPLCLYEFPTDGAKVFVFRDRVEWLRDKVYATVILDATVKEETYEFTIKEED